MISTHNERDYCSRFSDMIVECRAEHLVNQEDYAGARTAYEVLSDRADERIQALKSRLNSKVVFSPLRLVDIIKMRHLNIERKYYQHKIAQIHSMEDSESTKQETGGN